VLYSLTHTRRGHPLLCELILAEVIHTTTGCVGMKYGGQNFLTRHKEGRQNSTPRVAATGHDRTCSCSNCSQGNKYLPTR
jgi:hypothetical protein